MTRQASLASLLSLDLDSSDGSDDASDLAVNAELVIIGLPSSQHDSPGRVQHIGRVGLAAVVLSR